MYLKHLEISGFKSFADHIKLDFEPGLTAVVGPNGCGKSNIIDAIRWCLGEMSAKSLRSNLMMDVVFNGSGSRPPQNLSEVTLTFDNTDKRLPIDFSDVSITRRLFRSGESEYFINKTQCRLRDIRELFLDTGMGEDGYSSMEQGKVEWILQAKPEERRELFEEAAGVSKYRARREEALRKIERIEIDLSRLADIIAVTQDQIRKLENAVNKAQTYQRVREQLKLTEIGDWLYQLDQSKTDFEQITARLKEAQTKAETLNTDVHALDSELSVLRLSSTQTEEELLKANAVLAGIDADIKIGEERINNARQRQNELEAQLRTIEENIAREQTRMSQLRDQEKTQEEALAQLQNEGQSIETDYATAKSSQEKALENLENKKNEVRSMRDLILDRAQERSRYQQQLGHLASDVSRLTTEMENRQKELKRAETNEEEITSTLNALQNQINEFKSQLDLKKEALATVANDSKKFEEDEATLTREMTACGEAIARLNGQIHSIQSQQTRDPYLSGAQAALSSGIRGLHGPLGKIIRCADHDQDLIASTFGEHLGDLIAETVDQAQAAIEFLSNQQGGRARIWILDKIPSLPELTPLGDVQGDLLLSRIQCDDRFKPLLTKLTSSLLLKGSTVYGDAFINGGSDPSKWKSHITHRLPELEKELSEKEILKIDLEQKATQLAALEHDLLSKREAALKEIEEVRIRLEIANEEEGKLSKRLSLLAEEKQVITVEITQFQAEKERAEETHITTLAFIGQLDTQEKEDHFQLDLRQQEMSELQQTHLTFSSDLSAKLERHNSFQEKLNWQKSILEHTRKDLASLEQSVAHHKETIAQANRDIELAKTAQSEAQTLIESSLSKRQEASTSCASLQTKRTELQEQITRLNERVTAHRNELGTLRDSIQTELINETTVKGRLESITQKLRDQYELSIEEARGQFTPQSADIETLEKLKKRVASIGPVNLAAPQEHAELSEKNNFLVTQQNDLLKAKDDLREVISKINATTREHFRETFQKVRENFRALYSQLFQGGEADLHFTNEADILSTGIDIFCQPPGKKLLHISLLSGGEKALTAVALLFAFFQVRPSPLALLDEVDAPLDEANVLRYVEMVKSFTQKSQFIVISHNKRTMEAANTLYGVTMEELGVSKVLSARLLKENKNAPAPTPAEPANA